MSENEKTTNVTEETNTKSSKTLIIGGVCILIGVIALFLLVRVGYSKYLDNKVANTPSVISDEVLTTENSITKVNYIVFNSEKTPFEDALQNGEVAAGDVFKVEVEREDATTEELDAYIVTAPDEDTEISFSETDSYVKISIPQSMLGE